MDKDAQKAGLAAGRWFFGVAVLSSGLLQLVTGAFVRIVPKLPAWMPAHPFWAYAIGLVLVIAGLALLSERTARIGGAIVGVLVLVMLVLLCLPELVVFPTLARPFLHGFMWTKPFKALALVGGAALLVHSLPGGRSVFAPLERGLTRLAPLGAAFLALFLVVCGLQHFVYLDFVTAMVPAWIPGQSFWARFTGLALLAGGVGILVPRTAKLAATLSALMIFLWVVMLHIPRAFVGPQHAFETAGIFEALALSGVALTVAATRER
jgi:uncharacterized membrane protein